MQITIPSAYAGIKFRSSITVESNTKLSIFFPLKTKKYET